MAQDLDRFYRFKGIQWERPRYEAVDILPHIPKEADVNELNSGLSSPVGTFCLLLKETGCRPCEGWATLSKQGFVAAASHISPRQIKGGQVYVIIPRRIRTAALSAFSIPISGDLSCDMRLVDDHGRPAIILSEFELAVKERKLK